ncbi:uncharacterized protein LOC129776912 isoform X2 [Toxorhynchites rutilus septentrionalis]|uniref:uncharacterized protein LOC129776912 isoform X2 n=1 Tax=Toxorhynchites rutilus septentrionalis TaxID=329112 RepID=UPI00247A2B03|nr:uncharacterized protein LOC129776912 isoform X2 [Toxorhynchites rutilus septentrionalis]
MPAFGHVLQLWLFLTFLPNDLLGKFVFDIQDNFLQCNPDTPLPAVNLSDFQFTEMEGGDTMQVSGNVLFVKEYGGFVRLDLHSQRLLRGTWGEGEISRSEANLCAKLQFPMEPWYPITKHFQQKSCPFKAGVSTWKHFPLWSWTISA